MINYFAPPSLQERAVAIVIFLALLAVPVGLAYKFLYEPQLQLNRDLNLLSLRYKKALKLQSRKDLLEQQLQISQKALANNDSLLLREPTASLAAAALQERVKEIVTLNDTKEKSCLIKQQKNMPTVDEDLYTKVVVNVFIECALEPLQAVLYDLETEKPLLILDELIVKAKKNRVLEARFDISGYIKKEPSLVSGGRK